MSQRKMQMYSDWYREADIEMIKAENIIIDEKKREITCIETFTCVRCKDKFGLTSTISNIQDEGDWEQLTTRVFYHPDEAPFDTGSDMVLEKVRRMCGYCLRKEEEEEK